MACVSVREEELRAVRHVRGSWKGKQMGVGLGPAIWQNDNKTVLVRENSKVSFVASYEELLI